MSKEYKSYFRLQLQLVAGLYVLACALQLLLFLPVSFMAVVAAGSGGALLLAAQIRLFYDTMYGRNAAIYQSLPVSSGQLVVSKILAAAIGNWLVAAAMGIAAALAHVLMQDSMSMVAFLHDEDARISGAETVLRLFVPTSGGTDVIEDADGLLYQMPESYYAPGQYALWMLNLLLSGAAVSAAIFLVVILYQTIRRSTGALLIGIFAGLATAVVAGICAYIALTGWLPGGVVLSFTARAAVGCAVNLVTLLLWGAACRALLSRWYAR